MTYEPQPRVHVDSLLIPTDEKTIARLLKAGRIAEGDAPSVYVALGDEASAESLGLRSA